MGFLVPHLHSLSFGWLLPTYFSQPSPTMPFWPQHSTMVIILALRCDSPSPKVSFSSLLCLLLWKLHRQKQFKKGRFVLGRQRSKNLKQKAIVCLQSDAYSATFSHLYSPCHCMEDTKLTSPVGGIKKKLGFEEILFVLLEGKNGIVCSCWRCFQRTPVSYKSLVLWRTLWRFQAATWFS